MRHRWTGTLIAAVAALLVLGCDGAGDDDDVTGDDESADIRDNVIYTTASGSSLAIYNGTGTVELRDNWLPSGWRETHEGSQTGSVTDLGNVEGNDPGFTDASGQDFTLVSGSTCIDAAGPWHADASPDHEVDQQYVVHQAHEPRPDDGALDIGAFERP